MAEEDYKKQLDTFQDLVTSTKNKIDAAFEDKYQYTQSDTILSHVQNIINSAKNDIEQLITYNLFQIQLQSLFQIFKQWTDDVQQLTQPDKNPFNDLQLQMLLAGIFHTQFALLTSKFLIKTKKPAKSIQSENVNTVLNVFYQCVYGRNCQVSFAYYDLICNFSAFFKTQITKYKSQFDEIFMTTDEQVIIQDIQLCFGDLWAFQDVITKILEETDVSQLTKDNLIYAYNIQCPFESIESSRLRSTFSICETFDEALERFKKQRCIQKQDLKQFPQFTRLKLQDQDESVHKYGRQLVNLLENAKCFQRQLPICISGNELIDLPKQSIEILSEQLNNVTQTSKQLCDPSQLSYNIINHFKTLPAEQRLRCGRDQEKNVEKVLQTSKLKEVERGVEMVTTASPNILARYVAHAATRSERKSILGLDQSIQERVANQMSVFYHTQVEHLYVELASTNREYDASLKWRDDVARELLRASEVEDKAVFAYGAQGEPGAFLCTALQAFIQLALNYIFLAYDQRELKAAALSGHISPYKSAFSTKNCIFCLQEMQQYWAACEPLALVFYRAQQLVAAICAVKQGQFSEQVSMAQRSRYFSHKPGINRFFIASLIHLVKADSEIRYLFQKYIKLAKKIAQHFNNTENISFIAMQIEQVKKFYENGLIQLINQALGYAEIQSNRSQTTSCFGSSTNISQDLMKLIYANTITIEAEQDFEVVVCGYHDAGKSSLINQLVYQPLLRFSTCEELIVRQETRFSSEKIISNPTPDGKPWWLSKNTQIRHKKLGKSKSRILNDEIMSTGSWLFLDTTVCDDVSTIYEASTKNIDMAGFIKNIQLLDKTQEESEIVKENISEKNNDKGNLEHIRPKVKLSEIEKLPFQAEDIMISDDGSVDSGDSYIPGSPPNGPNSIDQQKARHYPPLTFQQLKPISSTQDVIKQSIKLVNYQSINFYDVPHFAFFNTVSSDQTVQQQAMINTLIQKLDCGRQRLSQEFQQLQKALIGELKSLMGMAGQLQPQQRQQQQQILTHLVDKSTNKLDMKQVQNLNTLIANQLSAEQQLLIKVQQEQQELQNSVNQLKQQHANDPSRLKQFQEQIMALEQQQKAKFAGVAGTIKQLTDEQSCLDRVAECHTTQDSYQVQLTEISKNLQLLIDRKEKDTREAGEVIKSYIEGLKAKMYLFVYSAADPHEIQASELKEVLSSFIQSGASLIIVCNKASMGHFVHYKNVETVIQIARELQQIHKLPNPVTHIFTDAQEGLFINDILRFHVARGVLDTLGVNQYEELSQNTYQV